MREKNTFYNVEEKKIPSNMILREDGNYYERKALPVGVSEFKRAIDRFYYVDKTLMIKEIIDRQTNVTLFTRPRRFGKSLNMDMLKTFFEISNEDNSVYFRDKKIWQEGERYQSECGKYPVIFLKFKDVKALHYREAMYQVKVAIQEEYARHRYLINSRVIEKEDKDYIKEILTNKAEDVVYTASVKKLSGFLKKYYNEKVLVIIDEYDTPINSGYFNGYYEEIMAFMRVMLSKSLKDNENLERAFMTGVQRVSKEGLFSGLNNVYVDTLLDDKYGEFFGFTIDEVKEILYDYGKSVKLTEIIEWYDGYRIGGKEIFNPWSVISYVDNDFECEPYWVNTGSTELIGSLIKNASDDIIEMLNKLLTGEYITVSLNTEVIFPGIDRNPSNIFGFLLMAGYLTSIEKVKLNSGMNMYRVIIPNKEVELAYNNEILGLYKEMDTTKIYTDIQLAFMESDDKKLTDGINKYLVNSISYFDTAQESFYHGMIMGMLAIFSNIYEVLSNREEGDGRYDISLIPRDKDKMAYVIEIKSVLNEVKDEEIENVLEKEAEDALEQIDKKNYCARLSDDKCKGVVKMGMAFYKKKCKVKKK